MTLRVEIDFISSNNGQVMVILEYLGFCLPNYIFVSELSYAPLIRDEHIYNSQVASSNFQILLSVQ